MRSRILVVDDHPMVRKGLMEIVSRSGEFEFQEAGSIKAALDVVAKWSPAAILLDLSLPDASGLDGVERILGALAGARILVVTTHPEESYGLRCLRAGALGYISKLTEPAALLEAVAKVLRGERYLTSYLADKLLRRGSGEGESAHALLASREFEVLRLLGRGKSVGEVAIILELSVKTVSTYRTRILEKLGLGNNMEIIRYCLREGLVD